MSQLHPRAGSQGCPLVPCSLSLYLKTFRCKWDGRGESSAAGHMARCLSRPHPSPKFLGLPSGKHCPCHSRTALLCNTLAFSSHWSVSSLTISQIIRTKHVESAKLQVGKDTSHREGAEPRPCGALRPDLGRMSSGGRPCSPLETCRSCHVG